MIEEVNGHELMLEVKINVQMILLFNLCSLRSNDVNIHHLSITTLFMILDAYKF